MRHKTHETHFETTENSHLRRKFEITQNTQKNSGNTEKKKKTHKTKETQNTHTKMETYKNGPTDKKRHKKNGDTETKETRKNGFSLFGPMSKPLKIAI